MLKLFPFNFEGWAFLIVVKKGQNLQLCSGFGADTESAFLITYLLPTFYVYFNFFVFWSRLSMKRTIQYSHQKADPKLNRPRMLLILTHISAECYVTFFLPNV